MMGLCVLIHVGNTGPRYFTWLYMGRIVIKVTGLSRQRQSRLPSLDNSMKYLLDCRIEPHVSLCFIETDMTVFHDET